MTFTDKLFIINHINYKYQNNILPQIPELIIAYLLHHVDNQQYYINSKTDISELLYQINLEYKTNKELDLLEIIIKIMEK